MAKKEGIKIKTNVKYELYNEAGEKIWEEETHNTDCYLHGILIADRMSGGSDGLITLMDMLEQEVGRMGQTIT